MVKPEGPEPLYFFAQHPRGLQEEWVEYFKYIFREPINIPSCAEAKINCFIEEQDLDKQSAGYPHTRFHFGPDVMSEDLPVIMKRLKRHVLCDTLQVAIFEDKFDEELIVNLEPEKFNEFLDRRMFQRLIKSLAFARDVERAVEVISQIKGVAFDPDAVNLSVNIQTDETTPAWIRELLDWESNQVLANALYEIAKEAGRPGWVLGADEREKEEFEETFHLTAYFSLNRICVGIEIFEDIDFHPYLNTHIQSFSGALSSYIAHVINPKPGNIVLDLSMRMSDIAMATLYQFDCLYYGGSTEFDDSDNMKAMFKSVQEQARIRHGVQGRRQFEMVMFGDLSQLFEFDLLYIADRILLCVDFDVDGMNFQFLQEYYLGVFECIRRAKFGCTFTFVIPMNHLDIVINATLDHNNGIKCLQNVNVMTTTSYMSVVQLRHR